MRKNWRISAWNLTNVRNKKEVIHEARTKGVTVHFAPLMDTSHLKKCWLGDKAPKIQRSSCIPRWYCERWFLILCSIHWTRISSVSRMTAGKVMYIISRLPGCAGQAADAVSAYTQVIMEDAPTLLKIPKSECPDIWIRLPRQTAQIMVQSGRPSRSAWTKSLRPSFGRTVMGKANWENPFSTLLGEGFQLGMLIRTPWKGVVLIGVCGCLQIGWREPKHWSDVESTQLK